MSFTWKLYKSHVPPVCNFYDFQRCEFGIGVVYCGHFLLFKKFREEFFPLLKTNLRHLFMAYFLGKKTTKFSKWERERYFQDDMFVLYSWFVYIFIYLKARFEKKGWLFKSFSRRKDGIWREIKSRSFSQCLLLCIF